MKFLNVENVLFVLLLHCNKEKYLKSLFEDYFNENRLYF